MPPATPAASQAAEDSGADTGIDSVTAADVAAALGLPPEGQETDDAEDGADDDAQDQGAEDSTGDKAGADDSDTAEGDDKGDDAGATDESTDDAAQGEAAAEDGASDTNEENPAEAADGDKPADAKAGKNEHFQSRINELTAEKKSAQDEAASLRERVSSYQARDSGVFTPDALDMVETPQELQQARQRYHQLHKWTLSNRDGGKMPDGKGGDTEFNAEEVAHIQAQTFDLLNDAVPKREQYLAARQGADATALESYPWLADKAKGQGAQVQKAIEALPVLRSIPSHRLIAANAIVGEQLRRAGIVVDEALIARLVKEKQAKSGAKPASNGQPPPRKATTPPPRAPAAPGRPGTLPARRTPAAAELRQQEKKLNQSSGSVDDIAASIAAKLPRR